MATRDLTKEFLERRNSAIRRRPPPPPTTTSVGSLSNQRGGSTSSSSHHHDLMLAEEGIQLSTFGNNTSNGGGGTVTPAPSWVGDVDKIEQCLVEIQNLQKNLLHMHAQRVGSVFNKDLDNMEIRIDQMTIQVTDQFRIAERLLQKVGIATKRAGGQQATIGANIQRSLAKRLQEQSVTFRQSQRKYLKEVQIQKSGGLVPGGGVGGGGLSNNAYDGFGIDLNDTNSRSSGDDFFWNSTSAGGGGSNQQQQQQQAAVLVDDLTEAVHSRDQEIVKIAQSIEELGSIFKELAVLVIDQGTILDRIDYNMETVVESTRTGIQQLEKAEKSQKNARPLRCIICLSTTIFILLFILILKHRPRRGWF